MDSLGSRKEELKSKIKGLIEKIEKEKVTYRHKLEEVKKVNKEFEEIYLKIDGLIREVNKLTEELKKM
jgi:uncharacterized coiled-coil DUF342 family protein